MGFDSERWEEEVAAVAVDHLRGEIVVVVGMDGWDWVWEVGDGVVLEGEVVELAFEGGDSAVYVGFCGFEGLELVEDPSGFVLPVGFHFRVSGQWSCDL